MRYPKITMWWDDSTGHSELKLHGRTLAEAREIAMAFGYRPPVWYKPWQYFTGGLGFVTVGFPY